LDVFRAFSCPFVVNALSVCRLSKTNFIERRNKIIGLFKNIFGGTDSGKRKRALVFVDFEHWYISLDNLHKQKPDIKAFRDELSDKYDIVDIVFFADFSNPSLRAELFYIRQITNAIVETQNHAVNHEKDFTDFIMLDHIYQSAITVGDRGIDAYVIFTGDGHFNSVVSFLVTKCKKEVAIYAVKNAVSAQLADSATYSRLLPDSFVNQEAIVEANIPALILQSLKNLQDRNKQKRSKPTFWATVEMVSKTNNLEREEVAEALRILMRGGYVYQGKIKTANGEMKILKVNWGNVERDGMMKKK